MDILFPWRKQPQPRPPQSSSQTSGSSGHYHSLPHPEEHAARYARAKGGGGGGNYDEYYDGYASFRDTSLGSSGSKEHGGSLRSSMMSRSVYSSVMGDSHYPKSHSQSSRNFTPNSSDMDLSDGDKTSSTVRFSEASGSRRMPRSRHSAVASSMHSRMSAMSADSAMMMNQSSRSIGGAGGGRSNDDRFRHSMGAGTYDEDVSQAFLMEEQQYASLTDSFTNRNQAMLQRQQQSQQHLDLPPMEEEEEDLPPSPLRQLLDAVNMSILPNTLRLSSLAQAVEFFDHRDRAMHDSELQEGAAYVLYHKLGLALRLSKGMDTEEADTAAHASALLPNKTGEPKHYLSYQQHLASSTQLQQQSEYDKEIAMICSCLEMVHRANPDAIAQTWDECGVEILPLLVSVLERPFLKIERAVWRAMQEKSNVPGSLERAAAVAVTRDQKLAVQKVTKVLAMYSLVPEAKRPMCECAGMLKWLTRIIDTHNYNRVKPGAPAIGGTASVKSNLARPNDHKNMDVHSTENEKRMELASRATSGSGLYMTEAARFNTIATLTNLAALEENRMPMLREPGLMDNVCRAVHNERSDVPKQCSALAIMNLSNGDPDHVPEMASNDLVLETLLKLMKEDNPETRRNAVVTIFNIACSDQNTVRLARYRDGTILEALTNLVGSDDPVRLHDEARASAAETIFNMSCSDIAETTDRMANHAGLLECLAVTLRGEHTGLEVKMYCSATLRRMAELIRYPMIAQGALLSALVKASTWTSTDCIAEAFRAQALVPENCVIMAQHHGLLNSLSRLALTRGTGPDIDKVRDAAVAAIELMSRQDEARAFLAQNEGIMMSLTRASYGEQGSLKESMRRSVVSEFDGSASGSYADLSRRMGDDEDSDEDASLQSRRIQVALKNLVSAM
ncbi:hypothetical protein HJC23_003009 [Cyclotella cryptica]|uniref:Vacuolar protein 8 n=1 Tax=Cyclotella cryptica TaxID=29204 RepID=A0ABD3PS96_9STRA|eukprot:CCRYP_011836-RA/>CCRYP_011836-RA protein AED:0.02 eAED:0.02 QI:438/1/1/1/1/1/3/98/901